MINIIVALSFDGTWTLHDYSPLQYLTFPKLPMCSKVSKITQAINIHSHLLYYLVLLYGIACLHASLTVYVSRPFKCMLVAIVVTNALAGQRRKMMEVSAVRRYFTVFSSSTVSAPRFLGARVVFSLPPRLLLVLNWQQYVFFNDDLHSYPFSRYTSLWYQQ